MQSFPDLSNKDNDAIPAKELLAARIKIRFMDENLRVGVDCATEPTPFTGCKSLNTVAASRSIMKVTRRSIR